jgi:creatinine amidohydrolase
MSFKMEFGYPKEAEKAKKEGWPVLIPVGTMEYHSTICPYGCDTLVSLGVAEKLAEKTDCVILPPVWYGVASYAVGGPENNTIHVDCDTFENYMYCILKSLFMSGFEKNIYILIAHQTEDYMPMTLACMKAAKKLIMQWLEDKQGFGWWGKNDNKDFYANLAEKDSPWNKIRVIRMPSDYVRGTYGADHAGIYECSMLESLFPGTIKLDRLAETDDWFAMSSKEMSKEIGDGMVRMSVEELLKIMQG